MLRNICKSINFVFKIFKLGAYEELAANLLDSVEILTKNWSILDNVLETLDIQQHSLGVLYVLIAKFNSLAVSGKTIMNSNSVVFHF